LIFLLWSVGLRRVESAFARMQPHDIVIVTGLILRFAQQQDPAKQPEQNLNQEKK
jgi:hypothetical protein